jgi:hypothetical protein
MAVTEKQDRTFPRTVADIERKYNFGESYAESLGIATDVQKSIEELGGVVKEQGETIAEQGQAITQQGKTLGIDDWNFAGVNDSIGGSLLKTEAYCGYNSGMDFGEYSANQINGDYNAMISASKIKANNGTYITFDADIMMGDDYTEHLIVGCTQIVFRNGVPGTGIINGIHTKPGDRAIYIQGYGGVVIENLKIKESGTTYTLKEYIKKVMAE